MDSPRLASQDADPCRTELLDDYDQMLHQSLTKVFTDRHLTSKQIKDLLRNDNSVIKSILVDHQPLLSALFSDKQLKKLSLLWLAVLCRYDNSVELLVRSGANVNETLGLARIGLHKGSTVLHAMVRSIDSSPNERLIRLVMDHGADLGARDYQDRTVLHYAVTQNRVKLAQMFLDNGANVNFAKLYTDRTPFSLITDKNIKNPMVQLIMKALALRKFSQPMIRVRDEYCIELYPKLCDYYQDCIEHVYRTKFKWFTNCCTFFQLLTQCPCSIASLMRDPNFENRFRLYDLSRFSMYAKDLLRAFERARNLYNSMLEQEDRINETVQYMRKCYCENIRRRELALLLHEEIRQGRVELIETLLEKGADVNFIDDYGRTPLLAAARMKRADKLLPLLIKRGANVFAKDRDSGNALYQLAWSCVDCTNQARALIEMGVSIYDEAHEKYREGFQPIHKAIDRGNNELVKVFLDHGADVNAFAKNHRREFPLYIAATQRHQRILETLLQRGADVDQRTIEGRTALHSACKNVADYNIIRLLLTAGADVLAEDIESKTPFALIRETNMNSLGTRLMIKALALKQVCLPSIELKDERIIKANPKLWSYYRDCHAFISKMKFTRFIKNCKFLDLLTMNRCQIATLMQNSDFGANFELYDLSGFSMYAEDILEAFERARNHYHSRLEQEDAIKEAVYYMLPDIVVRKVVRHIFDCCKNVKC